MGLDQYLYARKYVSGFNFQPEGQKEQYAALRAVDPAMNLMADEEASPHGFVQLTVAYWRKSNQIHKWFVTNVQGGVDECQLSPGFTWETLRTLRDLCKVVLDNRDQAAELLPTGAGFFFGSTEYDDYYFGDLEATVERLDLILKAVADNPHDYAFYYQSSW